MFSLPRAGVGLPLGAALLLLAAVLLLASFPPAARADSASCDQKRMTIVAHEDDDLIFQNPAVLEAIGAGDCVRTVYVTAGDAGKGETYWRAREEGPRAAYAVMAGVANSWISTEPVIAGHAVHLKTLVGKPTVSQVYLRLPDGGGGAGTGYEVNGRQSVPRLWRSQNPQPASLSPISSINALDGSATYSYEGLLATLRALIAEFEPDVIGTQNFSAEFGGGDHADHIAVARFVQLANAAYKQEHVLRSYMDYESKSHPQDVFEPQLGKKLNAYYAYAAHDSNEACTSQAACESPFYSEYWAWLKRQYVVTQSAVPGSDAGPDQSVASKAAVTLNGSASSDPLGHSLSYEWKQTAGPTVSLSNSHAVKPSFTAPAGPATLTFSLVVKSSEAESLADSVTVTVAAAPKFTLSVSASGSGAGTVSSSPSGIECPSDCEGSYEQGTKVTLTASPGSGSEFKGWSGACSGTGACEVTMGSAKSVGAEFALQRHQLTVTKSGAGSGGITSAPAGISCGAICSASFDHGTEVTLTATPAQGSSFVKWTGACSGSGACNVSMSSAKSVGAEFAPVPKFALSVSTSGNGSGAVSSSPAGIDCPSDCEQSYEQGTEVTLTPAPAAGSEFKGWSGACSGAGACEVTMSAARSVGAEFALQRHQLTVSKAGAGSGTVSSTPAGIECGATCAANFDHGTVVKLTGAPGPNSKAVVWESCPGTVNASNQCEVTMSAAKAAVATFNLETHRLTVEREGTGSGAVTSSPAGISCGSECAADFDHGTLVKLTGAPAVGSKAVSWSGCDKVNGGNECEVAMSASKAVTATFDLESHQLSVAKSGAGSGTVTSTPAGINCGANCSASFDHGTEVTLSASPAAGSFFVQWTGACSGNAACKVTMSQARSVEAEFVLVPKFVLSLSASGNGAGAVTSSPAGISCPSDCEEAYEQGTNVTLTPAPAAGSEFTGWSGACSGSGTCEVTMSAAKSVGAEFALERHQLTATKSGTGTGTVTSAPAGISCGASCSASFDHGTEVTLTAAPAAGSSFVGWSGACAGTGSCKVTMSSAKSVGAEFALVPKYALRVNEEGNGTGTVTSSPAGIDCSSQCAAEYLEGTKITLTPAPAAGSEFKGWSGACSGVGACEVTMNQTRSATARFDLERHTLTVSKTGSGSGSVTSAPTGISCGATCAASFDHGSLVKLTAIPAADSEAAVWTGCDQVNGSNECEVTMSAAQGVTATFSLLHHDPLAVTRSGSGSGTVASSPAGIECGSQCTAEYLEGTVVTLTGAAEAGSKDVVWETCPGTVNASNQCEVTMSQARNATARFDLEQYALVVTKAGAGTGTVTSSPAGINCGANCSASFDHGTEVTLSAAPAGGSTVVWSGCDQVVGGDQCKVSMDAASQVSAMLNPPPDSLATTPIPTPVPTPIAAPDPPLPAPPNTKLLKAKVEPGTATFVFAAQGSATRFRCALAPIGLKLTYKRCSSPRTYRHLAPGVYVFKVKAVGTGGADPQPVTRRFRVADPFAS